MAFVLALGVPGSAIAADVAMAAKAPIVRATPLIDNWTYSATLYAWLPMMNGSTTVKGRTTDVNVDFNDLMDLVRDSEIPKDLFAMMGYFEARKGRLSLFADLVYLKMALSAGMTRSRGIDELNATVGASAGLKVEMFIAEMAAAYEVAQWGSTGKPGSGTALDVFAGARAWWQKADASLALSGTLNTGDLSSNADRTATASANVGWVDPLIGLRSVTSLRPAGISLPLVTSAALMWEASFHGRRLPPSIMIFTSTTTSPGAGCSVTRRCSSITRRGPVSPITNTT